MDFFEIAEKSYSHKEKFLSDAVPLENLELTARVSYGKFGEQK